MLNPSEFAAHIVGCECPDCFNNSWMRLHNGEPKSCDYSL